MDLLHLIVTVSLLGAVWYVLTRFVPMPPAGKTVLSIAFAVVVILCLMSFLGIGTEILHYKPHIG